MLIRGSFWLLTATASIVAPLGAQGSYCYVVPGGLFGIQAYQCANCGFKTQSGAPTTYTYFAEPVVTQATAASRLAAGDVVVAVDGSPITTQAGADRFAYPADGAHTLTIRRGRDREDIRLEVRSTCAAAGVSGGTGMGGRVSGGVASSGSGGRAIAGSIARSSGGTGSGSGPATGKFGFAVTCRPSCSAQFGPDGQASYKYDGYPPIVAIRSGSAADRAGLRPGDEITRVEGKSILEEAGVLQRAEQNEQLHLTVRRDGKDMNVVMVVTP